MITLTGNLNLPSALNAEFVKMSCLFEAYPKDAQFWIQDEGKAFLSLIDGNMIIYNINGDCAELAEFVNILSPACIFSSLDTLKAIDHIPKEEISVMYKLSNEVADTKSDLLKSDELYDLLNVEGLSLPDYPHFATDICYRLNHNLADYFAIKNTCAAISFKSGKYSIMNGIASHKKGYGSIALKNILAKNYGNHFLVCCRQTVKEFYIKNGFRELYKAGYWVKNL